jgi:hypothetical protein
MPGQGRVTYGGAVYSRLTDLGVAAIPLVLGVVGPGARRQAPAVRIATATLESQREQLEQIVKLKEYLR